MRECIWLMRRWIEDDTVDLIENPIVIENMFDNINFLHIHHDVNEYFQQLIFVPQSFLGISVLYIFYGIIIYRDHVWGRGERHNTNIVAGTLAYQLSG